MLEQYLINKQRQSIYDSSIGLYFTVLHPALPRASNLVSLCLGPPLDPMNQYHN